MFILPPLSKSSLTIFSWPLWLATCKQETSFSTSSTYTKIGYSNLHAGRRSWFFFESECKSKKKKNHNFFFFLKLDITLFNLSWLNEDRSRKCIYTIIKLCSYSEFLKSYLFPNLKKKCTFSSMIQWKLLHKLQTLSLLLLSISLTISRFPLEAAFTIEVIGGRHSACLGCVRSNTVNVRYRIKTPGIKMVKQK